MSDSTGSAGGGKKRPGESLLEGEGRSTMTKQMTTPPLPPSSDKKRCPRNATFVVTPSKSTKEGGPQERSKDGLIEIRVILYSKLVRRDDLELIWCEKMDNLDGFTDPLAKAIPDYSNQDNVAHRNGVFMYGSRVKPDGTVWMNSTAYKNSTSTSSASSKQYPRRFYLRQLKPEDDRKAVLQDICAVSYHCFQGDCLVGASELLHLVSRRALLFCKQLVFAS
jgi:hypothetical protein